MHKKLIIFLALTLIFLVGISIRIYKETLKSEVIENSKLKPYGVFIGLKFNEIKKLEDYELVVIDASEFSYKEISTIKSNGQKVYTYLNVGALETYRPYYNRFKDITLGVYDNWPDERWVDVSQKKWQDFITNEIAADFVEKGVDGFFIDNADVYYEYHQAEIYNGLKEIFSKLSEDYGLKIIINGGDTFISEAINENNFGELGISAINQETVFSAINFDNKTFGRQKQQEITYYKNYLDAVRKTGLSIFLLEYVNNDKELVEIIDHYCRENGFLYYVSNSIELN